MNVQTPLSALRPLLPLLLLAVPQAQAQDRPARVVHRWQGVVRDRQQQALAPPDGYIEDHDRWARLWRAWRDDEQVPAVDFHDSLILVATARGPNRVRLTPRISDDGKLHWLSAATKMAGEGFGYELVEVEREGFDTIVGDAMKSKPGAQYIRVEVVGTLKSGVVAIGGETTGITISSQGITWELSLQTPQQQVAASELNGQLAMVRGTLSRRAGVERPERWIVQVDQLQPAP